MTEVENAVTEIKMTEEESSDDKDIPEVKSDDIKETLTDVENVDTNTTVTDVESSDTNAKVTVSESSGPKAKVQRCETCNTFCVGEEAFEKHLQSQKHKDKVEGKTTVAGDANKKDSSHNKKDEEKSKSHSRQARKDSSNYKKIDSQSKSSDKDRDRRVSSRDKGRYDRHDVRRRSAEHSKDRSVRRAYHSRSPHRTKDRSRDRKSRTTHSKKKGHLSDNESEGEIMYLSGSDWEIMDETNDDDENQPIEDGKENTNVKPDPTLKSAADKNDKGKTVKESKVSLEKVSNHSKTKLDKPETKDKAATKSQPTAKDKPAAKEKSNITVEKNEKSKNADTETKNKNTENLKDGKDFFCENLMASVNKAAQIAKLQAHVDRCAEPLLGLSLVLEIPRVLGEPYYKCLLCDSNCIGKSIISHIKGYKHCVTYLQKFHPAIAAKIPQNKKGGRGGLEEFIQKLGEADRKEKIIVAKEVDAVEVARKICESRGLELILNQEGEKQTTVTDSLIEETKQKIPIKNQPPSMKSRNMVIEETKQKIPIKTQPPSMKSRNMVRSNDMNNQRKFPEKTIINQRKFPEKTIINQRKFPEKTIINQRKFPEKTIIRSSRQNLNSERNFFHSDAPFQARPLYMELNTVPPNGHASAMSKLSKLDAYFGFSGKTSPIRKSLYEQSARPIEQGRFDYNDQFSRTDRSYKDLRQYRDRSLTPPRDLFRRVSLSPVRAIFTNQNRSSRPRDRFSSGDDRYFRDDFGHCLDRSPRQLDLSPRHELYERNPRRNSFSSSMDFSPSHQISRSPQRDNLICSGDGLSTHLGDKSSQQEDLDHQLDELCKDPSDLSKDLSLQLDNIPGMDKSVQVEEKPTIDNYEKHTNAPVAKDNFNLQKVSVKEELKKRHPDSVSNQDEVKQKYLKQENLNPSLDYFDANSAKKMIPTADSIVEPPSANPPSGVMTQNKANYLAAAMLLAHTLLQKRTDLSDKEEIKVEKPITSTSVGIHELSAPNIPPISPLEQFNVMSSNFQQQMGFNNLNFSNQQLINPDLKFGNQLMGPRNEVSSSFRESSANMGSNNLNFNNQQLINPDLKFGNQLMGPRNEVSSSFRESSANMITDRLNGGNQQMANSGYYNSGNALHLNQRNPADFVLKPPMNLNENQPRLQNDQSGFQNQYPSQSFGVNFNNATGFNSSNPIGFQNNRLSGMNKQLNLFEPNEGFGIRRPSSSFGSQNLNPVRGFQFSGTANFNKFSNNYS